MRIRVNWGEQTTNAKFTVGAKDVAAAVRLLDARDEWGKFEYEILWTYEANPQGIVTTVTLTPSYRITMPTWPAFRRQPDAVKADWNVMWKALKRHEEGHKRRFLQRLGKLIRDIESLRDAKGGDIDILGTKALNEIEEKQRKYDEKTDHGRSKGVTLHVP